MFFTLFQMSNLSKTTDGAMQGKVILGISAHPDDLEFGCAGTFAKWIQEGATGYYLIVTDGTKGSENRDISSHDLKKIRYQEQEAAASVLGVTKAFFLDYIDGELENNLILSQKIVRIIRQVRPDIVITMDPSFIYDEKRGFINHSDHRAAGQAALDAIYPFARNARTFPDLVDKEHLQPHIVREILLVNFQKNNFFVDISDTINIKLEALAKHASQRGGSKEIQAMIKNVNKTLGQNIDAEYAEGFLRINLAL